MSGDVLQRLRAAFDAGADPYEHVELDTATRLGGAMALVTGLFGLVAVQISQPSGPLGWTGVLVLLAGTAAAALTYLLRRTPAGPLELLLAVHAGLLAAALFRAAAGPDAPFAQVLFVVAVYACIVHPLGRASGILLVASLLAWSPALYEPIDRSFVAATVSQLLLIWCLGPILVGWMTRVRRQRGEAKASAALARIDALTSVQNRRALEEQLPPFVSYHRRHQRPFSVLVADLDDFKHINDRFGHQVGDDVLRKVARSLAAALRLSDPCFRWGGDEFVALLPEAGHGEATDIADRVRDTVALSCRTPDDRPVRITVGVAQLGPGETGEALVERADAALLARKARRRSAGVASRV